MKLVSIIFLVLFISSAHSQSFPELPAEGTYKPHDIKVLLTVHHVVVPVVSADYRQKIKDLEDEGYTCSYTSLQMTKCVRSEQQDELPTNIIEKVKNNWFGHKLTIGFVRADPTVNVQGDSFEEWQVAQEITFKSKIYADYRLMVTDQIKKIAIGKTFAGAEYYFNFDSNPREFSAITQEVKTISRFEYVSFLISINYK